MHTPTRDSARRTRHIIVLACTAAIAAACQSTPKISSQTAPQANLTQYHTYGFMEKLGTDTAGYTSITTQLMKDAVSRQLATRGLEAGANPDLLVNFISSGKDKVEGTTHDPRVGVSYGHGGWGGGWGGGLGVGVGIGGNDIRSVHEERLTVDVVDRASNTLVWSGTAVYRPTEKDRNDAKRRVDDSIARIFARYPVAAQVAVAK
jgi:hypothetical protein